jgi:hypothetical protein
MKVLIVQKQVLKTIACPCTKIVAWKKLLHITKNIWKNKWKMLLKIIKIYWSKKVVKYYKKYCSEKSCCIQSTPVILNTFESNFLISLT